MKRLISLFLTAFMLLSLLAGCGGMTEEEDLPDVPEDQVTEEEKPGIKITSFALPIYTGQTLDPISCSDGVQWNVSCLLFDGLFGLSPDFRVENKLCDSYEYDADSFTYEFHLRSGVSFSDGSDLTAGDAAAALQRALGSERYGARLRNVSSFRAVGSDTLRVVMKTADTTLPALLDIPIIKSGSDSKSVPLGTGAYSYVTDSDGDYLTRNDSWWNNSEHLPERIYLVKVKDEDAASYRFSCGEVQFLSADLIGGSPISTAGSVTLTEADTTVLQYLGFRSESIFGDVKLRQALSLGLDRKKLVSAYLSGHAKAAQFPISPASYLYPAELEAEYDQDKFENAMKLAGFSTDFEEKVAVTLLVNSESAYKVSIAGNIASLLAPYGIEVQISQLDWEEYLAALQNGSYDLYFAETKLTAAWDLAPIIGTGGALNYGRYSNEQMDTLIAGLRAASNPETYVTSFAKIFAQQTPIVPICFKSTSIVTPERILSGISPTAANPFYDMQHWNLHLDK